MTMMTRKPTKKNIRKATHHLALAMLPGMSFFEVLRQKLKWSGTAV